MHLLWKRYAGSGYAPAAFYVILAGGFVALAAWSLGQRDWLVAAIALVMIVVTLAGSRLMRRLGESAAASRREIQALEERRHE